MGSIFGSGRRVALGGAPNLGRVQAITWLCVAMACLWAWMVPAVAAAQNADDSASALPVAEAGIDRRIEVGQSVILDGTDSLEPQGNAITAQWQIVTAPDGSNAALSDAAALRSTLTPDLPGNYEIELVITNALGGISAPDLVRLSTDNIAPVAMAGADQIAQIGQTVWLDPQGSFDLDGAVDAAAGLSSDWTLLSAPNGSIATLLQDASGRYRLTPDLAGRYEAQLTLDDGALSSSDVVSIYVSAPEDAAINIAPVADAGADAMIASGQTIALDGTRSSDANGDRLTFSWALISRPIGSTATISQADQPLATFAADVDGLYVAQLTVTDPAGLRDFDTVVLDMTALQARPDAGAEAAITDNLAQIDGRASEGATGYLWSALGLGAVPGQVGVPDQLLTSVQFTKSTGLFDDPVIAAGVGVLSDYNLFVIDDIHSKSAVGGRTAIGGDSKGNRSSYGTQMGDATGQDVLRIGGDILGGRRTLFDGGDLLHAGRIQAQINFAKGGAIHRDTGLSLSDESAALQALSSALRNLPSTATHQWGGSKNSRRLTLNAAPDENGVAVFSIPASDALFEGGQRSRITLNANNASTVIINVDSPHVNVRRAVLDGDFADDEIAKRVIWNFHDAQQLHINQSLSGAFLGPKAKTKIAAPVTGSVAVKSLHQMAVIKRGEFSGVGLIAGGDDSSAADFDLVQLVSDNGAGLPPLVDTTLVSAGNLRPIARISASFGTDAVIAPGETVRLDGGGSSDDAPGALTYDWRVLYAPEGANDFGDLSASQLVFDALVPGPYVLQLSVSDGALNSDLAVVSFSVENQAPIADAGAGQTGPKTAEIILDGTGSSDPEGAELSYAWAISNAPAMSAATLINADTATPRFKADVPGTYEFALIVSDGFAESEPDRVTYLATNQVPVAVIGGIADGADDIAVGAMVMLTGAQSSDGDGDALTYQWSVTGPAGASDILLGSDQVDATFKPDVAGTYVISLIVSDGFDGSVPAQVTVSVVAGNRPPILAEIGAQSVAFGDVLTLQLSAEDPDGDAVQYLVSPLPLPRGSAFNVQTGLFTYRPTRSDADVTLTFGASDGTLIDAESIAITVTGEGASPTTDYTGQVVDAQTGAPIAGVTVMAGDRSAVTDASGVFLLTDLTPGSVTLWVIADADTQAAPDGSRYAATQIATTLYANVQNRDADPIGLSTLSTSGTVTPGQATVITGSVFGVSLTVPADAIIDMTTGNPYSGPVSIAAIGPDQANELPPNIVPCQLFSVEPKSLQISQPVTLSVENYDNLPAGAIVDIWVYANGVFAKRGTGTVTADAARIEAQLRNIPGGAAIALAPRPATVTLAQEQARTTYVPSLLGEGNFSTAISLPGYASLGAQRGLSFVYNSTAAAPMPIVNAQVTLGETVPVSLSSRIDVGGVDFGRTEPVLIDPATGPPLSKTTARATLSAGQTTRQSVQFDASTLPTGVTDFQFISISNYACSRVGQATPGQVFVDNQMDSPFGKGWSLAELTRLYPQDDGSVLLREGDGTLKDFAPETDFSTLADPVELPALGPFTGELIDLDDDGDKDILWILPESAGIGLYENLGGRQFQPRGILRTGAAADVPAQGTIFPDVTQIAVGDFDADGRKDIAAAQQTTEGVYVFFAEGEPFRFTEPKQVSVFDAKALVAADFNGDGDDDIVAFGASSRTPRYFGGSPDRKMTNTFVEGSAGTAIIGAVVKDYNKDGRPDIVARSSDRIIAWLGRTRAVPVRDFVSQSSLRTTLGAALEVTDIDDDGREDVLVADRTSGIKVFSINETGFYRERETLDIPGGLGPRSFGIADLNRDGRPDIVTAKGQSIITFLNDPDGTVGEPDIVDVGFLVGGPRLSDLDGDGSVDVVVDSQAEDKLFVYFSDPSRSKRFFDPLSDYTELTRNDDGSYSRRFKDGTVLEYNADGLQTSATDSNGNVTAYAYDAQGRITRITDPVGGATIFTYGAEGRLTQIAYPDGRMASWTYNEAGELIRSEDVNGDVTIHAYDPSGRLTAKTDPRGLTTEVLYGPAGRYSGSTLPDGTELKLDIAKAAGLPALGGGTFEAGSAATSRVQDGRGNITITEVNDYGSPVKVTDPLGRVTIYERDADNNVTAIIAPSSVLADGTLRTEIDYDGQGNVIAKREAVGTPLQREMTYAYEPVFNKMIRMVDADGFETTRTYDAAGNMLTETDAEGGVMAISYDSRGLPLTRTDKNGNVTQLSYNNKGLADLMIDPSGTETDYLYDDRGNLIQQIDDLNGPFERRMAYSYDEKNRILSETAGDGGVTRYAYDGNDNLLSTTDPTGIIESRRYDDRDRLLTVNDSATGTTTMAYDPDSNLLRMTDALGEVTEFTYDAVDRLLSSVDAKGQLRAFGYDLRDNITTVTDARANTTRMSYDALDRPIGRTNPLGEQWRFAYDLRDNRTLATKPDGVQIATTFDGLSRLTRLTGGDVERSYAYDPQSNLLAANDNLAGVAGPQLTFAYDQENRNSAASVANLFGAGVVNNRFDYTYDALDRRASLTDSFGGTTAYAYDAVDRLTRLTTPGGEDFVTAYDLAGRMLSRSAPNVTDLSRAYEAATGRLSTQSSALLGSAINAYDYAYTDRGNIAGIDEAGQITRAKSYSYDELERLTEVAVPDRPDEAESYTLDPEGNRLTSQRSSAHDTDAANRLRSDDRYSYLYDLNGNLTGKTPRPGAVDAGGHPLPAWAYAYDALDQLISVSRDGFVVERYRYDAFGRRSLIETLDEGAAGGPITAGNFTALGLANDGADRTLDLTAGPLGAAQILRRYTHGQSVDEPLQMEAFSGGVSDALEVYTYHTDHVGSVRALTDSAGNISHAYDYDSYGNLVVEVEPNATPAAANPFRFTAREWDAAAQLYHYRARGYDPDAGRFIQEDPIGFAAGDLNVYRYVWANPLMFTDPTGMTAASEYGETTKPGTTSAGGMQSIGMRVNCLFTALSAGVDIASGGMTGFSLVSNVQDTVSECGAKAKHLKPEPKTHNKTKPQSCALKSCFSAGTMVHTSRGLVPIEEVEVGDEVKSLDQETGEIAFRPVTATHINHFSPTGVLTVKDQVTGSRTSVSVTSNHPIMSASHGWIHASELRVGDRVIDTDGNGLLVLEVTFDLNAPIQTTYNLEVATTHNYFVGEDGLLVHNGFGAYVITKDGFSYAGKGDLERMRRSMRRLFGGYDGVVADHFDAGCDRSSFILEHQLMMKLTGGKHPSETNYVLNKILSPGAKY